MGKKSGQVLYFELKQGASHKFWEISLNGKTYTVRYGRFGTGGQSKTKSFASPAEAVAARDKLIEQKTKKGYASPKKSAKKQVSQKVAGKSSPRLRPAKKKKVASRKKSTSKKSSAKSPTSSTLPTSVPDAPKLFFVEIDAYDKKKWVSESVTPNYLDVEYDAWWSRSSASE